jgi:hypothetical protein
MAYDLAFLVNAHVKNAAGAVEQEVQTVVFRPVGSTQIVAQRTRQMSDARAGSWTVGQVDIAKLDPKYRVTHGKFDAINHNAIAGVSEKGGANLLTFHSYRPATTALDVAATACLAVEVMSSGYVPLAHTEVAEVASTHKVSGNVAQRLAKCQSMTPRGAAKVEDVTKTQHVSAWIGQESTFNTSRWGNGVYSSSPRGEYTFAAYDGTGVGAAHGEKVVVEKRLFDKVFPRPNGEDYYGRMIGEHEDVEVLTKARSAGENVLLFGPPGTGKTALVEAAYPDVVTILGTAETEVADFVGSYTQRPGEGFVWVDGPLIEAMEGGKALLVDEIGLVDPKVLSVLYSVMDGRGALKVTQNPDRGTVNAKDGFYVIAATNPHAPGVQLSEALISRFTIQVEVDSDYELALHLKVSRKIVSAAQNMDRRRRTGDMLWAPQLRELFAFKRNEALFGTTFAARSLVAGAPEIDRDTVADIIGKALKDTITPLRMEG